MEANELINNDELEKLAKEFAVRTVLESDKHSDAVEEVTDNFIEGYMYLGENVTKEVYKRFGESFSFGEEVSESDKYVVRMSYMSDFITGLLYAIADELGVDIPLDTVIGGDDDVPEKPEQKDDKKSESSTLTDCVVKVLNKSKHRLPEYQSVGAAGFDIKANTDKPMSIHAGERVLVPTGLYFEIPLGYEMQIRPRSGLALKHGLTVLNTPGTIDSDYRGEVGVIILNTSDSTYIMQPGERIAQGVIAPVKHCLLKEVSSLSETERGAGGFGHSGK